ncbi:trypsin-like serine peptidase [Salipiger mucosus]|uniref:Serine protease n=1 Tax=Salipiger mucosus DSM 16094 TaxID=1123237 RepID=S9QGM8_9RHOB|nr:serine protease [Salipiger mucosus]EPX78758.1 Trypsin domain protein [Salipiger mucosus DSM 16094]
MMRTFGHLGLVAALTAPAGAQELPALPRADHADWTAVGRVNTRGYNRRGMCSGALVAPDLVLTAAHCIAGPDGNPARTEDLHFVAGWLGGDYAAESAVTAYRVHPEAYARVHLDIEHDLALLTLADPMEIAPLPLVARAAPPYAVVGYHDHRPHMLSARFDCAGLQDHAMLRLDCPVRPGNSGGPVLSRDGDAWSITAVISAAARGGALAVPVDDWVRQWLD